MRGTDAVVRTLANIIATFGPQRVRADVESASLNRLLNLAAVVEQQVETPEICSHTRTRTLVLHPRQAAEYLRRQRPACPGAFPPALVDCEEAAKQGALLHTGYVRDLLEFVQRHDLVLVYENQFVSASDNVTFAADETHVVLDTRSAADAHVLHKIRTLARRRHGTDFAHPDSGFDLVNPQPWRASSVQLDGAARIAAVTATLRRTSPPTTVPAEALPFNKDASLHVIRQLGTKLQHRVLAMPRSTSADLSDPVTVDQPLVLNRVKVVNATFRAWAGTPQQCRQKQAELAGSVVPRERTSASDAYAAGIDCGGRLFPKRGGCLLTLFPTWASHHLPHFTAVVWSIEVDVSLRAWSKLTLQGIMYNSFVHVSNKYSPTTFALARQLCLRGAQLQ